MNRKPKRDKSFFRKPFFWKFVVTPLPPFPSVRWWKKGLRGLLEQVKKAIKIFFSPEVLGDERIEWGVYSNLLG